MINDPKFVCFICFVHTEHLRVFFVTLSRLYTLFLHWIKLYCIVERTTSNRVILTITRKNNIIHGKQLNHLISPKKKKYYSTWNCHACTRYFYTIKLYCIVKRTTSNRVILTIALKNNIIHGKQFNHLISPKKKKHYSTFLLNNIVSSNWKTFQDKWTYFYGLCNCWIIGFKKL